MDAPSRTENGAPARIPAPARSWRALSIGILVLAHALGLAWILFDGAWLGGIVLICSSHLWCMWGTLMPGSRLLGPVVDRFETPRREVWLTIDDGPSAQTRAMLDLLDAHGARATFFLVSQRAEAWPEAVREIRARGHDIGNHTATHSDAFFWAAPPARVEQQVADAQRTLERLAGSAPRLFRAVAGMANVFVAPVLRRHGLKRIAWSARGYDSVIADPARVSALVLHDVRPGAIVLLHEGARHGASVDILRRVLAELDSRGYRCVLPEDDQQAAVRLADRRADKASQSR